MNSDLIYKKLKYSVGNWLCNLREENDYISYRYSKKTSHSLFTTCISIFILDILRFTDIMPELVKTKTSVYIKSHQCEVTGLFYPKDSNYNKFDKIPQQLTCFCLTALRILGAEPIHRLKILDSWNTVSHLVSYLDSKGCGAGQRGSGNFAMFVAIFLTHELKKTGDSKHSDILEAWFDYHNTNQNRRTGFWGSKSYFSFQNAYHQFEIYNYHNRQIPNLEIIVDQLLALQSKYGTFSPGINGGFGSCWDYDAANILANSYIARNYRRKEIIRALLGLRGHILNRQNKDGGFPSVKQTNRNPMILINYPLHILSGGFEPELWIRRIEELIKKGVLPSIKNNGFRSVPGWTKGHWKSNTSTIWDTWFSLLVVGITDSIILGTSPYRYCDTVGIGFFTKNNNSK